MLFCVYAFYVIENVLAKGRGQENWDKEEKCWKNMRRDEDSRGKRPTSTPALLYRATSHDHAQDKHQTPS